jgi:hypothetical protein
MQILMLCFYSQSMNKFLEEMHAVDRALDKALLKKGLAEKEAQQKEAEAECLKRDTANKISNYMEKKVPSDAEQAV